MCFKKLRSLKKLNDLALQFDFEQGPIQRLRSERKNEKAKAIPGIDFYKPNFNPAIDNWGGAPEAEVKLDWSNDGETSAGTGTTILKGYDEPGKAKCSECGYIRNTPHEIYLLPLDNGKHKFVCIYCYKEEESN